MKISDGDRMSDSRVPVRVRFSKSGRAKYISHLDLLRTVQRAIKRSGLPVWYSEGFNPRIYLSFPLALPVGCDSICENVDFYLTEDIGLDEVMRRLDEALPEGIKTVSAAPPVYTLKDIGAAEYEIGIEGVTEDAMRSFLESETIEVQKFSKKKGMVTTDIKPHITVLGTAVKDDLMIVSLRLPAGNTLNINAQLVTDAFTARYGGRVRYTKRTNILCADGSDFE